MPPLPGPLVKQLVDAFLGAFDSNSLNALVRDELSQNPEVIAAGPSLDVRVRNLIGWAERHSRIPDLLGAALHAVPGNALLAAVQPKVAIVSGTTEHLGTIMQRDVLDALRRLGFASSQRLDELVPVLDPILAELLPRTINGPARLNETFELLNHVPRLSDGSLPLRAWLERAASPGGSAADLQILHRAIAALTALESGVAPLSPEHLDRVVRPGGVEKIVHTDDMLPFSFLRAGIEVGRSVCRLIVPIYANGSPSPDITGKPRYSYGSGWLLSPDLLMTNHHVIDGREPGEPSASDTDLQLQAANTVAQFDYDAEGVTSQDVPVKGLLAWSPTSGPLDYAIVRLAVPAEGRRRLRLVRTRFALAENSTSRPAVNIIQHPGRRDGGAWTMYKMLACRNNLVFRTDGPDLWYFTDTLAGSSGSPVCNDEWQVVALHKRWAAVDNVSYQGKPTGVANVGTQIQAILADLAGRPQLRGLYDEILAAQA